MSVQFRLAVPADMPAVFALRTQVFVRDQGVPADVELDEHDARCEHAVALADGEVVGTGRLLPPCADRPGVATIGRMAVAASRRGRGVGAALLTVLEARAAELGYVQAELHAQVHARRFYDRAGYEAVGDTYVEAGIEHVTMTKPLGADLSGSARREATG